MVPQIVRGRAAGNITTRRFEMQNNQRHYTVIVKNINGMISRILSRGSNVAACSFMSLAAAASSAQLACLTILGAAVEFFIGIR